MLYDSSMTWIVSSNHWNAEFHCLYTKQFLPTFDYFCNYAPHWKETSRLCDRPSSKGKGKGKGLDTCYSATYTSGLVTSSALQSRKWQLIGMSQWCRSALCGHPLPALTDDWTHGAASRHTIARIRHTRPSLFLHLVTPLVGGQWIVAKCRVVGL